MASSGECTDAPISASGRRAPPAARLAGRGKESALQSPSPRLRGDGIERGEAGEGQWLLADRGKFACRNRFEPTQAVEQDFRRDPRVPGIEAGPEFVEQLRLTQ